MFEHVKKGDTIVIQQKVQQVSRVVTYVSPTCICVGSGYTFSRVTGKSTVKSQPYYIVQETPE